MSGMSRRIYVDVARLEEQQTLNGIRRINSDFRVRVAQDTEAAIALVAEWKKTGKVPDGMKLPAMEALYGISLIRRNVEAVLRQQAAHASNGHATPSAPVTDDPLLNPEQVRERNKAALQYRQFMQKLMETITNPEELLTWAFFHNRFSSPPPESALRKIAAIYHIASRIPGGPAILQAQHRNVRWAELARAVSQVRDSAEFAWIAEQADACATDAGLPLRFGAPGTEETFSFLNDCTETVRQVLVESGLAEDLRAHYEKFTCGSNVRLSQDAAQRYARAVDTLRHSDPHGLAALRKYFRTLPWDFVDDFTKEGPFIKPAVYPAQTPAIPTVSATQRFMQMGLERNLRDAAEHGTHVAEATAHTQHEAPTAESAVTSKEEPVSQPNEDTLIRAYLQKEFGDADRERMAAVMATEDGLMAEITAVEELLNAPSVTQQVRQRVLSHMQTYAAKLVEAVAQHGREPLEMYFHLSEETMSEEADGAAPGSATEANIVIATDEGRSALEPEGAVAPIPLEEHDPRLAGFVPVLQKMDDAKRDECEALLRTLKPATERTRGRVPDRHRDTCFQLLDLLPSTCDPQLLFDYLNVTGDQVRGWRREAMRKKTTASGTPAPAASSPSEHMQPATTVMAATKEGLPDMVADPSQRAEIEGMLPFLDQAAKRLRGRVSDDNKRRVLRMLELLPADAAGSFLAYVKVRAETAEVWKQELGAIGAAVQIAETRSEEDKAAEPIENIVISTLEEQSVSPESIQTYPFLQGIRGDTAARCINLLRNIQIPEKVPGGKRQNIGLETKKAMLALAAELKPYRAISHMLKHFRLVTADLANWRRHVESAAEASEETMETIPKEETVEPAQASSEQDTVVMASDATAAFATYPYLRKVTDPAVQSVCYTLLQSLQLPAKEPGKNRILSDDTKRLIIRIYDALGPYRAGSAFLDGMEIVSGNILNWRKQLDPQGTKPPAETNGQARPAADPLAHEGNGHAPATRRKAATVIAPAPRFLPEDQPVRFVNAPLQATPKSAVDAFDETATDGRDRAMRLAIVRGALERRGDPAARDRWYAEHNVTGSDVLQWMHVYGDLMGEERQTATKGSGDPRMKAEKHRVKEEEKLLQFKPGNHYGPMESFVDDVTAILMNPFDDFAHMAAKYDEDFMGNPDNRELHRRLVAGTMNPLSDEEVRTLRAIVQTRPEDCEQEDLHAWREGIAKRFGLEKNVDTEEFAYALLEALRDPRQQAAMKEAAMSAFS